jgi:hypothetical protein
MIVCTTHTYFCLIVSYIICSVFLQLEHEHSTNALVLAAVVVGLEVESARAVGAGSAAAVQRHARTVVAKDNRARSHDRSVENDGCVSRTCVLDKSRMASRQSVSLCTGAGFPSARNKNPALGRAMAAHPCLALGRWRSRPQKLGSARPARSRQDVRRPATGPGSHHIGRYPRGVRCHLGRRPRLRCGGWARCSHSSLYRRILRYQISLCGTLYLSVGSTELWLSFFFNFLRSTLLSSYTTTYVHTSRPFWFSLSFTPYMMCL